MYVLNYLCLLSYVHDFPDEQQTSVAELGAAWNGGEVKGGIILKLDTRVRVIRCGILRYVTNS